MKNTSLLFSILLVTAFSVKSQVFIPQQYVGQNINMVIYNGSFTSTGNCTGQDYDFDLKYSQISPFATGVELNVEITSLTGTATLNGNTISQGNTFALIEPVTPLHFQFTGAGSIDFSVYAAGTPTVAAETYPCYIVEKVSQFTCNNTYTLMEGEVFVPCTVATATGITEIESLETLFYNDANNTLAVENVVTENSIIVTDILGKIVFSQYLGKGKYSIVLPLLSNGVYIASIGDRSKTLKFVIH